MSSRPFVSGWFPELANAARSRTRYARAAYSGDDRPLPGAFSLSQFRLRHLEQGQAGTCWVHAPTQSFEIMTGALGYSQAPLCRMLVGYQGTVLMAREGGGRRRNPTSGGSVTDAFKAMGDAPDGVGVCHESLWPYSDSSSALGASPPAAAIPDANPNRVHQVAEVAIGDGWKRSIFNGRPVAIGIWWPYGWDNSQTFMDSIGSGTFGHALAVIGWCTHQNNLYWQLDNWHGLLYPPLDAAMAATVPGYRPIQADKTSDFWPSDAVLRKVIGYGDAEAVAAAGMDGFSKVVVPVTISDGLAE
jgi:hypothetical protein